MQQRPPARLKPGVLELLVCVPALKAGHLDIRIIIMIQMVICSCSYLWSVFVFQGSVLINSKMVRHMKNTQTFHKLKSTTVFCINCAATLLTSNFRANMSTQLDSSPCPSLCVTCPEECSAEKYCSMLKPETGGKPHSDCYIKLNLLTTSVWGHWVIPQDTLQTPANKSCPHIVPSYSAPLGSTNSRMTLQRWMCGRSWRTPGQISMKRLPLCTASQTWGVCWRGWKRCLKRRRSWKVDKSVLSWCILIFISFQTLRSLWWFLFFCFFYPAVTLVLSFQSFCKEAGPCISGG